MLKKFFWWFVIFGLSFLVSVFGWTEQGKAFLFLNLGSNILLILVLIVVLIIAGITGKFSAEDIGISFILVLFTAVAIAIELFATWGATQLFDVDFYVAYQIMTFGQCLCTESKKDD